MEEQNFHISNSLAVKYMGSSRVERTGKRQTATDNVEQKTANISGRNGAKTVMFQISFQFLAVTANAYELMT